MKKANPGRTSTTFLEHLAELRRTVIWIVITVSAGGIVVWYFSDGIIEYLARDLDSMVSTVSQDQALRLHIFDVSEALTTRIKISILGGFLLTLPLTLYKVWQFISPGLFAHERNIARAMIILSVLLFYGGVAFAYLIMVRWTVVFLLKFKPLHVIATIRLNAYASFVIKFCLTFGVVFQEPLVVALIAWLGLIKSSTLRSIWTYVTVGILMLAAIITPPDMISQILVALPMIGLYWFGYILAVLAESKRKEPRSLDTSLSKT